MAEKFPNLVKDIKLQSQSPWWTPTKKNTKNVFFLNS